jgi:hypothetical protein
MSARKLIPVLMLGFLMGGPVLGQGVQNPEGDRGGRDEVAEKRKGYRDNLAKLEGYRKVQGQRYADADAAEKKGILAETRKRLEEVLLHDVFPAWYGTDWAFEGTTTTPGEGRIACGYFVSTCLNQVGFKVNRIKLAQQPSQRIIETFMDKTERNVLVEKPMTVIREYLKKKGDGLYIVGLDSHVGFVSVSGDDMAFIHSSYYEPESFVKSENIDSKNPLSDSKYRVFGKILSDEMVRGWLSGREYPVKTQ